MLKFLSVVCGEGQDDPEFNPDIAPGLQEFHIFLIVK